MCNFVLSFLSKLPSKESLTTKTSRLSSLSTKYSTAPIHRHQARVPGEMGTSPSPKEYIFDVMALADSRHLSKRVTFAHSKKLLFKIVKYTEVFNFTHSAGLCSARFGKGICW